MVVGGGPAGSAAAITCAGRGLEVVLLHDAGSRARPGETFHPGVEPLLRQVGLADWIDNHAGFVRHEGHWSCWGSAPSFVRFGSDDRGPWLGYQAHRSAFDGRLLERAVQCGARLEPAAAGLRPRVENGRVTGVAGPEGSIRCRFVVDASGGRHWLARRLGLGIEFRSPRLTAWYGYCNGDCPSRDEAPQIRADDQGWVWTARVAAGRYAWTRLLLDGGSGPPAPPEELAGLEPDGRSRASDVTWRSVPRSAGPGYFVAGDAAWVLDPATSHGVLKALMSGMQAGDCIDRSLRGAGDLQASHAYSYWMDGWFRHDLAVLRELYLQLPRPPLWLERASTSTFTGS